jgi:hypothetical protein
MPGQTPPAATPATGPAAGAPATGEPSDLGDAGKRAIDAMKAERDAEQRARKAAEKALDELRLAGATDTEKAIAKAKADGAAEVTGRFHDQIRRSEVRVALTAAGMNPGVIDLAARADEFAALKVGDDGAVDGLDRVVAAFKTAHGDLFAGKRPTGSADAGGITAAGAPQTSFTRAQLRDPEFYRKNRAAIQAAQATGRITG